MKISTPPPLPKIPGQFMQEISHAQTANLGDGTLANQTRLIEIEKGLSAVMELLRDDARKTQAGFYHRGSSADESRWAPEVFDIFGLEKTEGAPPASLIYERVDRRDLPGLVAAVDNAPHGQASFVLEYRIHHPQRGVRHLRNIGGVIAFKNDRNYALIGTLSDITNEYTARTILAQANSALSNVVDSRPAIALRHGSPAPSLSHDQLARVEDWILEHLDATITVEQIAAVARQPRQLFSKLFKQTTGLSPYQFVLNAKLEKGKELLAKNRNEKIAAIATRVGFFDQSHFHRHFRKKFGLTPAHFLKTAAFSL